MTVDISSDDDDDDFRYFQCLKLFTNILEVGFLSFSENKRKKREKRMLKFFWRLQNFSTHDKCAHAKKKLNQKHHETVRI